MGTKIQNVVPTTFSIQSVPKAGDSFGIPLIFGTINNLEPRVQTITSLDDLPAGVNSTDTPEMYRMFTGIFGQTSKKGKSVSLVKLGNKVENENAKQSVTFDVDATGGTFKLGFNGVETTAIAYDAVEGAVKSALEALDGIAEVTVALNSGATAITHAEGFSVEFTGADGNKAFASLTVNVASLTTTTTGTVTILQAGGAVETWLQAYTACKAADPDYFIIMPAIKENGISGDITELMALFAQTQTESKIPVISVSDANTIGADAGSASLAKKCYTLNYDTMIIYTEDSTSNAGACLMGATLPDFLAGINPNYYPLTGVVADNLTSTEIGYAVAKNANRIESIGGYTVMPAVDLVAANGGNHGGILSSGQFIDLLAAKFYLEEKVSTAVFDLLIANTKIPFTLSGFEQIRSKIYNTMVEHGAEKGIVDLDSIVVTMPDFETYSTNKKAQRWLDGVDGDGTLQGAINKITIGYNLTV